MAKAAAFLTHPSVRDHKLEEKMNFLKKKGLDDASIEAAIKVAESTSSIDSFVSDFESTNPAVLSPPRWGSGDQLKQQLQHYQNVGTFWLVLGGLAYAGYKFFKVRFFRVNFCVWNEC